MWTSIYMLDFLMMLPIVAIVLFMIHDWWKRAKEAHHAKRH